jgi:ATP-binding cassette subfamily C protein LapB
MQAIWYAAADLALQQGRRLSPGELRAAITSLPEAVEPEAAANALRAFGFFAQVRQFRHVQSLMGLNLLPALVKLKSGSWAALLGMDGDHVKLREYLPGNGGTGESPQTVQWSISEFQEAHDGLAITTPPIIEPAAQTDAGWFWHVFKRLRPFYGDCATAAVLINLLALAGSMFSMNVYDRIIPNGALHSLWVLALGVLLAGVFETGLRTLRAHLLDEAGRRADLTLSAAIFSHIVNLRSQDRPSSSGQLAGQLREFESVREFVSSSTLVAMTDLPFALLFIGVIAFIGGWLAVVPVVAALLIVGMGYASQWTMKRSVEKYQYENTQKHAFLVEALERLETIEALGAATAVRWRWERLCALVARSAMESRFVSALALNLAQFVQQSTGTVLIVVGVYMILDNHLTTGALIGSGILASRVLGPMSQVAALLSRWQHTKLAFQSIHKLMLLPSRTEPAKTYIHLSSKPSELMLERVRFAYPRTERIVLEVNDLRLSRGEIVAVMGPVGSGKSTLLRVLAGLQVPQQGQILLDGIDVRQISPADWRTAIGWVGQDAVLFRGTLRENLLIAAPEVSDARFVAVLKLCGLDTLIANHPEGLDMQLGESGTALSGGQRQMVVLARALLSDCAVLLLDEPTSAFDVPGEQALLTRLHAEFADRLVVIATHRPAPLELAQRLVILDRGQGVADGPRDRVLSAVRDGAVMRSVNVGKAAVQGAA